MKYDEALRKPFTDIKKLAIGIILSMIPIVNFTIVQGFFMENSGAGKAKASAKMPEWKDWSYLFVKGLGAFVVKIIYMIPALAFLSFGIGVAAGDMVAAMANVVSPELMGQMVGGSVAANEQVSQVMRQNWYLIVPGLLKAAPLIAVGTLLALLASFVTPIAVLNYLSKKNFAAAFDFSVVLRKAFTPNYALAWLTVLIVSAAVGFVLKFIPWIGASITLFIMGVIGYSLYGQVFKEKK